MAEDAGTAVWGWHAVQAVLARRPGDVLAVFALPDTAARLAPALPAGLRVNVVGRGELDRRAPGAVHQGVLALARPARTLHEGDLEALLAAREAPLLLVLDGVQDPHNLGACLRSADAAGADAVIVPRRRAVGLTAAVRKTASGAAEHVPLVVAANLARVLRMLGEAGVARVAATADAQTRLPDADLTGPVALVLGGEGDGLRALTRTLCDAVVAIPMHGAAGSLNVSVAAGICLYEAVCQRGAARALRGGRPVA